MCGIMGYLGAKSAAPLLLDGLDLLSYRGYDSAGLCVSDGKGDLQVFKAVGDVVELRKIISASITPTFGIAHTRWATHGKPTETNAHPHLDCRGEIAIAHNGIIENYAELRRELEAKGHKFVSNTDSEVLAHLIEDCFIDKLEKAVTSALKKVEGTFGLAVMKKGERKLVAANRDCSILVGLNREKCEFLVSSEGTAIAPHTKEVVYLGNNEIAVITDCGCVFRDFDGKRLQKEAKQLHCNGADVGRNGYEHYMLKEIFEQPETVARTIKSLVGNGKAYDESCPDFSKVRRIIITACGTSWHSALIGKHLFEKNAGIVTEVDYASEFRYRDPMVGEEDLVIVISQSGETADTLAALNVAKLKGAKTLGIVNVAGSKIAREVDYVVYLQAGPEIGVASTKAFTCQVASLAVLSALARQQKKLPDNGLIKDLLEIPAKMEEALKSFKRVKIAAQEHKDNKNCLYLGRGLNFPVALEGALKLKEISYIHAEGYPAAEMKHGPIALVDENMLVIFVATEDGTHSKIISNMQEIRARGGHILAIVNGVDEQLKSLAEEMIVVPICREELAPLVVVIPLQLLAYQVAVLKGCNVDKPRNLAKSVTVE